MKCEVCGHDITTTHATKCNGCWEIGYQVDALIRRNPQAARALLVDLLREVPLPDVDPGVTIQEIEVFSAVALGERSIMGSPIIDPLLSVGSNLITAEDRKPFPIMPMEDGSFEVAGNVPGESERIIEQGIQPITKIPTIPFVRVGEMVECSHGATVQVLRIDGRGRPLLTDGCPECSEYEAEHG